MKPIKKIRRNLGTKILGYTPTDPVKILWDMIDEENAKAKEAEEADNGIPEIRCDYIDAWLEAIERMKREMT